MVTGPLSLTLIHSIVQVPPSQTREIVLIMIRCKDIIEKVTRRLTVESYQIQNQRMIFKLLNNYNNALVKRPLLISMVTGFTLSTTADIIGNLIILI